jgi:hypothetical protein
MLEHVHVDNRQASASTFKSNVFDRLTAQRNKVGQSKYKKLEQVARALRTRPVFVEWHEVAAEARADDASDKVCSSACASKSVHLGALANGSEG